jgi:hypothetical protein
VLFLTVKIVEFPEENIIEKTLINFEKKHPVRSWFIRLKIKLYFIYFSWFGRV